MSDQNLPRRNFVKLAALGTAGVGLTQLGCTTAIPPAPIAGASPSGVEDVGVKLGVASYSLRNFSRAQAIEMTKALGTRYINLKSMHLPYELPPAEIAAARQELEAA